MLRTGISFVGVQVVEVAAGTERDKPAEPVTTNVIPTARTRPSENCSVRVPGYVPGLRPFTIGCTTIWVGWVGEMVASVGKVTREADPTTPERKLLLVPVGS